MNTTANLAPAPSLAAVGPDEAPHHATACLNCGTAITDRYCAHCGQDAHHTHRFTLRFLLFHDLPHSIWHVDKGVGYTLRQMLTRPGATLHEYMAGRRAQHFRPITYLLLITAVSMLLLSAVGINPVPAAQQAEMPRLVQLVMERYMQLYAKYPTLIYLIILPANAALAVWLLRPSKFNFAEMLLSQAFISGTTTIISTVFMVPLLLLIRYFPALQSWMMLTMLPYMAYSAWVFRQLLEPARMPVEDKWVRSIGTVVLQTMVLVVSLISVQIVIMFSLIRQDPSLLEDFRQKTAPKSRSELAAPVR
ncbi:DUF3667 domain-containing protein [Solirubrum puertoriconensis]|uniref:DUF3667 domain-containing protein n=1 Tax=Solirubrum puertoriconensis TaxID=1751427 RepID=A0A9X0HM13_SOLP1|nr:DUF3667 domain-containing protein [Solirubrum puertoriconensis]KUG08366.1 hypothetical protein ASU33_09350 [Solirubrum puertoriconensis]